MKHIQVQIPIVQNYFDEKEFKNDPVKTSINFDYYFTLNQDISNGMIIKLSDSQLTLKDNLILFSLISEKRTFIESSNTLL